MGSSLCRQAVGLCSASGSRTRPAGLAFVHGLSPSSRSPRMLSPPPGASPERGQPAAGGEGAHTGLVEQGLELGEEREVSEQAAAGARWGGGGRGAALTWRCRIFSVKMNFKDPGCPISSVYCMLVMVKVRLRRVTKEPLAAVEEEEAGVWTQSPPRLPPGGTSCRLKWGTLWHS